MKQILKKIKTFVKELVATSGLRTVYYQVRMAVDNRIFLKKINQQKLNIIFIAFEPATWLMFQSVYELFKRDTQINVTIFVIPYAHSTLPEGVYKDDGLREYLDKLNIPYIYGYNEKAKEWIDIFALRPDYVFYQAPYNGMYPNILRSGYVSQFAQICYIPYGAFLQAAELEETVHPKDFFNDTSYFFLPSKLHCTMFIEQSLRRCINFDPRKVIPSGLTKTDNITIDLLDNDSNAYRNLTVLWTPRWNTSEGVCTFFDYYDYFIDLTDKNKNITLIFRPHPLMFQNFLKTKELSEKEIVRIEKDFTVKNRLLDKSGDYSVSFKKADVLVSDVSSMMYEFFMYYKPVIYTHKKNFFNTFGEKMAETFYKADNAEELTVHINALISGNDYKKTQRFHFIKEYIPQSNAAQVILNTIKQ